MPQLTRPRPIFIQGRFRALPLLSEALTGKPFEADIGAMAAPARLHGFSLCTRSNCRYPGVINRNEGSFVDGFLIHLQTAAERRKLDVVGGASNRVMPVLLTVVTGDIVEADVFVQDGELEDSIVESWDLNHYVVQQRMSWLDMGWVGMAQVRGDLGEDETYRPY